MFSDEEILDGIIRKDTSVVKHLYNSYQPVITKWILKNSGTAEDSADIFHEAFLVIFRKINTERGSIELNCAFSTYFFSICKHLWFQELRARAKISFTDLEKFNNLLTYESYNETEEKKFKIYIKQLSLLESKCRELLLLYCKKKSLTEIMQVMGFKNTQAVADKKKNCRKKLISNLLNSKEYKEFQSEVHINY